MSVSRREVRRLRSAGREVIETGPGVQLRRVLWWLLTGRRPAAAVSVVRARHGWSR